MSNNRYVSKYGGGFEERFYLRMQFHCFLKNAIQKDDREPTFPHRIRTVDWSRQILINNMNSYK